MEAPPLHATCARITTKEDVEDPVLDFSEILATLFLQSDFGDTNNSPLGTESAIKGAQQNEEAPALDDVHPQKDDSSTASDNMELSVSKLGVEASAGSDESNGKCGEASFTSSIKAALEILDREDLEYMLYPAWLDAGDSKASREGVSGDSANEADKRTQTTVGASDSGEEPDAALEKDSSVEPSDDDALYETPQGRRRRLGQEKAALRSADNKVTGGAPTAATEISGTNPDSPSGKFKIFVTLGASPTGPSDSEQLQTGQNESGGESSRKNAGSDEATQLPNEEKPQNERQGAGVCSKVAALEDKGSDGGASIMGTISAQMGGQIDSDDELIDSEVFRVLGSILGNSDTIPTKSFSEFGPDGELDASFALALELAEMEGGLDVQRAVMTDAFSSQGIFARQDATKNGSLFPSASSVGNNYYGTDNSYISRSNPFQSNNIGAVQSETRIPSASGPAPTTAIEDDDWEASLALMIQLAEAEGGLDNQRESLAKLGLLEEDPNLPRTCSVCIELQPLQNLLQLPCERHYICSDTGCLENALQLSIKERKLYTCCNRTLPPNAVRTSKIATISLPSKCVEDYALLYEELNNKNPLYCGQTRRCEAYIPKSAINGEYPACCTKCGQYTCPNCRTAVMSHHSGLECKLEMERKRRKEEEEAADKRMQATAEEKGWKLCSCGRWVEKTEGCNHIKCRCGGELCYRCGEKWDTERNGCSNVACAS